ncbi:MAG: class I SAM-dependent methyltransferase [Verrucomicrobia bacterium]|nr:class I SAM-dependent methyltransferase [Verrucomicrobiota bacterium]
MPTIQENVKCWNGEYDWTQQGEEWSLPWGGSETQWWGSLLPRIHAFVPCESILEIAPGYGRWTRFLKDLGQRLTVVDLSAGCIEHCRRRFAASNHIHYFVNDGQSLDMVADQSIDFVFSFDSLVHAEADVLETYLQQLARKLTRNGAGFIHHSNAARYGFYLSLLKMRRPGAAPPASGPGSNGVHSPLREGLRRGKRFLVQKGILINDCARALSMSAGLFGQYCDRAGLRCVGQEIINWSGSALLDCISIFARPGSIWDRPNQVIENRHFVEESRNIGRVAGLYSTSSFSKTAIQR